MDLVHRTDITVYMPEDEVNPLENEGEDKVYHINEKEEVQHMNEVWGLGKLEAAGSIM